MNTPTKQTVYLPVEGLTITEFMEYKEGYFFTPEQLNEYTANVIKQSLETAAEKAVTKNEWEGNTGSEYYDTVVNRQSITNTYEETFQKFKV
jgi:hypothetical protein